MDKCLHILVKENKEVYISGDFNTNLLRLENNTSHPEFYNLVSLGFLPQILDPTRVTESSVTIIDNTYTNCHKYNHYSGNILPYCPVYKPRLSDANLGSENIPQPIHRVRNVDH